MANPRDILRFLLVGLVTFAGSVAWQWWLGDPCLTQYLEAQWDPPVIGLLGVCDYFPGPYRYTLAVVTGLLMEITIGFAFSGRAGKGAIVATLAGVAAGAAATVMLLRWAMLETSDVWVHGAYSPPGVVDCVFSGASSAAVAGIGVWLRRSRNSPPRD